MGFDFFKKKGKGRKRDDDLFDPMDDAPEFDELEDSSEFLSGENYTPAPDPAPHRVPPPPPPPAPRFAPPPRPSAPPPRPASPPPPPPGFDPDLTMVNRPPIRPAAAPPPSPSTPVPPAAPTTGAVPPAAPGRPAPPTPAAPGPPAPPAPVARPVAPARQPQGPPPALDDDKTQIMSTPVGAATVVAWLVVASGANKGQDFRLPGGMVRIGREAGNDIRVDFDISISGWHAEVSFQDGQYVVRDLGSSNGSFVNEGRISEASLRDNDRLRLGQTVFVFKSLTL